MATTKINVVDSTVGTTPRVVPTQVWYPGSDVASAARPHPPYPLLVFSQGYDLPEVRYSTLLHDWASAGFVVAAPSYPHTGPSDPAELDEGDILNHPADLRSVITSLIERSSHAGSVLSGLVNPNEVGLVGHSDGGEVSLAVGENTCCRDTRVKAVAILSGAELAGFGGTYFSGRAIPLLVVQGSADMKLNPAPCSAQLYNAAPQPKYYLDLLGAGHVVPYVDPGGDQTVIARATTDFFEAELAGKKSRGAAMVRAGNVAGYTTLTTGRIAPQSTGDCPTAQP